MVQQKEPHNEKKDYHAEIYSSLTRLFPVGDKLHEKFIKGLRENFTSEKLRYFFCYPGQKVS